MLACRNFARLFSVSRNALAAVTQEMPHVPVMVDLVAEQLQLDEDKTIIDMTFGAGGHTKK